MRGDTEYDYGVIVRPPSSPGQRGRKGQFYIEWYDPPWQRNREHREQRYRVCGDDAHALAAETSAKMGELARDHERTSGRVSYQADATWGQLVEHYLDVENHGTSWTDGSDGSYYKQQRSLAHTWVVDDGMVVARGLLLRDVALANTTRSMINRCLGRVQKARAYDTYRNVHKLLSALQQWAWAERFLPKDQDLVHGVKLEQRRDAEDGNVGYVPPELIPGDEHVLALAAASRRLRAVVNGDVDLIATGEDREWWRELEILFAAYTGLREGEWLALRKGFPWELDHPHYPRVYVGEQHDGRDPKWRRKRYGWIPGFLVPDLKRRLAELPSDDSHVFPSPAGGLYSANNWRKRVFNPAAELVAGWNPRGDYCPHLPANACRGEEHACEGQNRRRWIWPPHSLRHFSAVFQLYDVPELDDEDVAYFHGHRNGRQLRDMYVQRRAGMAQRAGNASRNVADPRPRPAT